MGYHPDFRLSGKVMTPVWEFAQEENLVISLDLGTFGEPSLQVDALARIAARYPRIRFVVEHIFFPRARAFRRRPPCAREARAPRKHLLHGRLDPGQHSAGTVPLSLRVPLRRDRPEIVGSDRIMWGSDLPSTAIHASYAQLIDYLAESALFDEGELRKVYADNAIRIYRL